MSPPKPKPPGPYWPWPSHDEWTGNRFDQIVREAIAASMQGKTVVLTCDGKILTVISP